MDITLRLADLAIVFATLLGPVLAVQAQRWVERGREKHNRRLSIFRTLMATRAASLSGAHVEALNAIPIEFYGNKKSFREVVEAWRLYLDHLGQTQGTDGSWGQRRQDIFIDLLWRLAVALNYSFSKVELKREVYSPVGHQKIEQDQELIREGIAKIFKGEAALPLDIKSFPSDPAFVAGQVQAQKLLLDWLAGNRPVKVEVANSQEVAR